MLLVSSEAAEGRWFLVTLIREAWPGSPPSSSHQWNALNRAHFLTLSPPHINHRLSLFSLYLFVRQSRQQFMSNSTNSTADFDPTAFLPPYLNLPPHLSAHKYFFVCTLTVAAWDTLVLSPRTYHLFRTKEWPLLKWAFFVIRLLMPIEFTIVGTSPVLLLSLLF